MAKQFDLFDKRDILISATREVLGLAESMGSDVDRRREYVVEATRISLRLLDVQKEIEATYGDEH